MSARATTAVFDHAKGTDAEWRMLAVLADAANPEGIVYDVSLADVAEILNKTERAVSQIKRRLVSSDQLVVLEEGRGRGKTAIYRIVLPGLENPKGDVEEPGSLECEEGDSARGSSGGRQRRSKQGKAKASSSAEGSFLEQLRDLEIDDEILAEAKAHLATAKRVGGRIVTPGEMACAAAALSTFNRLFEFRGSSGSSYGLGAAMTSIVERCRERPTWDAPKHVRLVESAWRIRWWEKTGSKKRPGPNVVYGPGAFEQVAQDAKEERQGIDVKPEGRRYTRAR